MSHPDATPPVLHEADHLVAESSRRGLVLRLAGSAGVLRHCQHCHGAAGVLGRKPPLDLAFFAYGSQQHELRTMFTQLGYRAAQPAAVSPQDDTGRLSFTGHVSAAKVDIFLDALRGAHTIEFGTRLDCAPPTAPTADLLLAKLQIHQVTEHDVKDIAALFASHLLGDGSHGSIDSRHIVSLMAHDWCLCYTALDNLATAEDMLEEWSGPAGEVARLAAGGIEELQERIELTPKSLRWKARARLGTRVRWYEAQATEDRS